ncbi:UDP-N-acetyl-D-mannosamine dehydrogenase [Alcanivorax xiamenensis]|uniref:UDP-N-acetyl-D-mannosamine dehydrogenase n=1 Tax=Alcanivorax xiamenensis TaxID=1177156 RepID=A0ABQ6Y3J5_9GAMM|nr:MULTISPECIES: UDP-N-acetyl-D-mannosamine dehydrogenase [Alcanivoracaceae]KAF0803374.1 UDP-N-acetyl-D-mannosamine dehydrogenase [Alcanivorax xiamenensis]SOC02075.1 UDP-N-acetyl-D-mannosaminuronic acid dehydrogenase [Alloalcanivorax xenomutans]
MNFDTICVVGLGYIGLPTATMFASRRKKVIGVDVNQHAVDTINRGEIHIVEPELDIAVHAAVKEGYLRATTRPEPADAFLVAVPTPFKKGADAGNIPTPDLSYIQAAADSIAPVLKKGDLVILESTSPVGATEQMAAWLAEARSDLSFPQHSGEESDIRVAHCPERVLPGHVMHELIENDRIIGGMTTKCAEASRDLYRTFVRGECLLTTARTAEMAKLTENAFRDVNIAFANELSVICDKVDIDVWELIRLANRHPRVNILQPGPGVGGHCIAVDPWFIVSETPEEARLIKTAREVNDLKPSRVLEKVRSLVKGHDVKDLVFYGVSFKADIDDLRESPALGIVVKALDEWSKDINVYIVEPNATDLPGIVSAAEKVAFEDAVKKDACHVLLVDHKEFKRKKPDCGFIVDTRGIW